MLEAEALCDTRHKSSITHDRAGHTQQAFAYDWDACKTKARARQRFLFHDKLVHKLKKKTPENWDVIAWYQSIGIRIPRVEGYVSRFLDSLSFGVAVCTSEHRYVIA